LPASLYMSGITVAIGMRMAESVPAESISDTVRKVIGDALSYSLPQSRRCPRCGVEEGYECKDFNRVENRCNAAVREDSPK
jgi:hypothetical protein